MGRDGNLSGPLAIGAVAGFVLLVAAIWASGASTATSLALTGVLVLIAVGAVAALLTSADRSGPDAEQRERMRRTTP